jgi:adenylosuccinate lyase
MMGSGKMFDHEIYLSPLTWRYGSDAMRRLWSEAHKRRCCAASGWRWPRRSTPPDLVSAAQVADLRAHQDDIDIARAEAIEQEIRHDLMAEIKTYAEQCPLGGQSSTSAPPRWMCWTMSTPCACATRST